MKTNQAWGWLAAGVLALGLNGIYHDGGAAWAHRTFGRVIDRVVERTQPVLALAAGRADLLMAKTGVVKAQTETAGCRVATALARVQTKLDRSRAEFDGFEAMSDRQQAAFERMEANRARIEEQLARVRLMPVAFHVAKAPVVCPRVRVNIPRITVPHLPMVRIPDAQFGRLGAGPI